MALKRLGLAVGLFALAGILCAGARADERILDFQSNVEVNTDASLSVTESIKVRAENDKIRHGIYRDFPTIYVDEHSKRHSTTFDVRKVTLDDAPVQYRIEKRAAGVVRVYIGDPDHFVSPGVHTYRLTYTSDRQLGYYSDFDEVYWNVTGNGWIFPIDHVESSILLPKGATIRSVSAYTGQLGARGKDYEITKQEDGEVQTKTTRTLYPGENLTVAVSFPEGFVTRPTALDSTMGFLRDNGSVAAGIVGLLLTVGYFTMMWSKVGRDPQAGVIVPQYEPPAKFTPAGCRFVREMGYDRKAFTAAVVNMAVKGAIKIVEDDKVFSLEQGDPAKRASLSKAERAAFDKLLGYGSSIELKQANHSTLSSAQRRFKGALANEFERVYFARNTSYFLPGAALAIVTLLAIIVFSPIPGQAFGMSAWLGGWSVGCYFLLNRAKIAWIGAANAPGFGSRLSRGFGAIFQSLFVLPFLFGLVAGTLAFSQSLPWFVIAIIAALILASLGYYHLLKAPTLLGRKALDHIEGFKRYLSVAEKDRMNFHNPPERTPELFEKFLPYALALDVENQWSEQFDDIISKALVDGTYHPTWYVGPGFYPGQFTTFSHSFGNSLSSAIASASASPRSSGSGSGGGGFSGGGGGGGGGGGW